MNVTAPFVLKSDVLLIPCAELSDDVRGRIAAEEGEFTLAHRHGRTLAQVVDGETAALLQLFREPRTIVDAVIENGRARGADPQTLFDDLLPFLGELVHGRVLVPAGSEESEELRPRFDRGTMIAGWKIVRCLSLRENTEIHLLRRGGDVAALKIARVATPRMAARFGNEIDILRRLDACGIAPRLIDAGTHDGRMFAVLEWIAGVDATAAAAQRRHDPAWLIDLCASIAAAYATLREHGVLHGDVHPHNVMAGDGVKLLGFGRSRFTDEQDSLAALLDHLISGSDFRALAEEPARRFASIAELGSQLAEARDAAVRTAIAAPVSGEAEAFLHATLRSFSPGGERFATGYPTPPAATINYGCAGAAVGLLRIAEARGDADLLALARIWSSRAEALIGTEGACYDDNQLARGILGDVTPYHTEAGIHAAGATIAAATGDELALRGALTAFVRASGHPCRELDLTLGRSGSLLAAALLLPVGDGVPEAAALRSLGAETLGAIWKELDARPPIAQSADEPRLGIAHGWAGYLYAALRWCAASGDALPPRLLERLEELVALRIVQGRGVVWRATLRDQAPVSGWCNGAAGHVFLLTLAHRLFGDGRWLQLAEQAAWSEWDAPRHATTLCCGTAGRAYALLNLYRHTGSREWLSRARQLANHAAAEAGSTADRPGALWKGELGAAVLVADLASPGNARMPFFE